MKRMKLPKKSTELYVAYDLGDGAKLSLLLGQSDIQYQDRAETSITATPNTITPGLPKKNITGYALVA